EERRVANENRLREANERISRTALRLGITDERLPFLCECFRSSCHAIVRVSPYEYERVRQHPTHYIYACGHDEGLEPTDVADRSDHVVVVAKTGTAGRRAEEADPRSAGGTPPGT